MIVKALRNNWFELPWSAWSMASESTPFDVLRSELERLVAYRNAASESAGFGVNGGGSDFELKDEGSNLRLTVSVPGLSEKDIDLKVTPESVVLHGERKVSAPDGYQVKRRERRGYSFERQIRLPSQVDPNKAEANLVNGVLSIALPKAEAAKPRSITVRVS
jgi:HSP20 family protein